MQVAVITLLYFLTVLNGGFGNTHYWRIYQRHDAESPNNWKQRLPITHGRSQDLLQASEPEVTVIVWLVYR